jgi:hypothetical protein
MVVTAIGATASAAGWATSKTFSGVSIGTAAADRIVVVCATGDQNSGIHATTPITIGGTNANMESHAGASAIGWLVVAAGTTANIVVTYADTIYQTSIHVFTITGGDTSGPSATAVRASYAYDNPETLSTSPTIPADGCGIVVYLSLADSDINLSWGGTAGTTEALENYTSTNSTANVGSATSTTSGSWAPSCSQGSTDYGQSMSAVTWAKAP